MSSLMFSMRFFDSLGVFRLQFVQYARLVYHRIDELGYAGAFRHLPEVSDHVREPGEPVCRTFQFQVSPTRTRLFEYAAAPFDCKFFGCAQRRIAIPLLGTLIILLSAISSDGFCISLRYAMMSLISFLS